MAGKALIVSAPSGAGKTTLVKHLLGLDLNLAFSVSVCSRDPRPGELDGVDYFFVSPADFRDMIAAGHLLEWQEVYPGQFYGTSRSQVEEAFEAGRNLIFDVDVLGGLNLKKELGARAFSIFIHPGSLENLESRLRARSTDSDARIQTRLGKAVFEMEHAPLFDVVVVNEDLDQAKSEIAGLARTFLFGSSNEKP